MSKQEQVKLGARYRDVVSGFEGVAVSVHTYLQGCRRVTLEKLGADGDKLIDLTFDEPNLESLGESVVPEARAATGGPHGHHEVTDDHEGGDESTA